MIVFSTEARAVVQMHRMDMMLRFSGSLFKEKCVHLSYNIVILIVFFIDMIRNCRNVNTPEGMVISILHLIK